MVICLAVVYRSFAEDPANVYSLLLVSGYLKTPERVLQPDGGYLCRVSIPNREIAAVYKSEILSHLVQNGAITRTTANFELEKQKKEEAQKSADEKQKEWLLFIGQKEYPVDEKWYKKKFHSMRNELVCFGQI